MKPKALDLLDQVADTIKDPGLRRMVDRAKGGLCPFCGQVPKDEDFKDELSRKEFQISGLCQKCQDETFKDGQDG